MRLLDLFCGAGGAAMGYHRAGFDEIVGVDIKPQPRYPFRFVQADALAFVKSFGAGFDVIHGSPPCQAYCYLAAINRKMSNYPRLIEPVRDALQAIGHPYVIENVEAAPLRRPLLLCGSTFGLRVRRHRKFEASIHLWAPSPRHDHCAQGRSVGVYGHQGSGSLRPHSVGGPFIRAKDATDAGDALGIGWMTWRELTQAIPPAYTEYIGRQLIAYLRAA